MNTRGRSRSDVYDGAIKKSGSPLLRRNISRTAVLEDPTFGTGSALLCDQVGLLNVNVRWRSRRRPRPRAGAPAALKNFVGQPENTFSNSIGTKWTCRLSRAQSALKGSAENICSQRAFPVLTQAV